MRIDPKAGLTNEEIAALLGAAVTGSSGAGAEATPGEAAAWPDVKADADASVLWLADTADKLPDGALSKLLGVLSGESFTADGTPDTEGEVRAQAAALLSDGNAQALALTPGTEADSGTLSEIRDLLCKAKDAAEASPFNHSEEDGFSVTEDTLSYSADGIASATLRATGEGDWLTVGEGDVSGLVGQLQDLTVKLSATPTPEPTATPTPTPEVTATPEATAEPEVTAEPTPEPRSRTSPRPSRRRSPKSRPSPCRK